MTRAMFVRVAVAAVLAIALSATGAQAEACGVKPAELSCSVGKIWDTAGVAAVTPTTAECCVDEIVKCTNAAFDAETFCPYGYKNAVVAVSGERSADDPTVEACCAENTAVVNDFPICKGSTESGDSAVQAQDSTDTNWAVHDGNGFTRTVGQYTGMCFSVTIANDCAYGSEAMKAKCCTKKPPSYLQFKIPKALESPPARKNALAALTKCKLSYGSDNSNARALKRVTATAWKTLGDIQYVNVPVTFKKGQKQATVCVYSLNAAPGNIDCSWTNLCGIDAITDAALGCEIRMVGKASSAATSTCCSPTLSIDAFDSSENRLAGGAPVSQTIELQGV